mgnify:CR=1 FL=1
MKYAVVFEQAESNFAAYVPDLPGCVATGRTRPEVGRRIREAIAFHLEGMRAEGLAIPRPIPRDAPVTSATFPERLNIRVCRLCSSSSGYCRSDSTADRSSGPPTLTVTAPR